MPKVITVKDYLDIAAHDPVTAFDNYTPGKTGEKKTPEEIFSSPSPTDIFNSVTNRDETPFIEGVANTPFEDDNEIKAQDENMFVGGLSTVAKMIAKTPLEMVKGTTQIWDKIFSDDSDYKNTAIETMDHWEKWMDSVLPTYYSDQSSRLSFDYAQKWLDQNPATIGLALMGAGIGTAIASGLEGLGAAVGGVTASEAGIGAKLAPKILSALEGMGMTEEGIAALGQFGSRLSAGAKYNKAGTIYGTSLLSRISESGMEASQTYQEAYQKELQKAKSNGEDINDINIQKRADKVAGEMANNTFNTNMPLMVLDALEFGLLFDTIGSKTIKKGLAYLESAALEGGEEGLQYIIQQESLRGKDRYDQGFYNRVGKYVSDKDFIDSVVMGAAGGVAFKAVGEAGTKFSKTLGKYKTYIQQQEALTQRGDDIAQGKNTDALDDKIFFQGTLNSLFQYDAIDSHIEGLSTLLEPVSKISKDTKNSDEQEVLKQFEEKNGPKSLYDQDVTAKEFFENRLGILKEFKAAREKHTEDYGTVDSNKNYSVLDAKLNKILNNHAIKAYQDKMDNLGAIPEFKSSTTKNYIQAGIELNQAKKNLEILTKEDLPEELKNIPNTELEKQRKIAERIVEVKETELNAAKGDYLKALREKNVDVLSDDISMKSLDRQKIESYHKLATLKRGREVANQWNDRLIHLYTNPRYYRSTIKQRYETQIGLGTNVYDFDYIKHNIVTSPDLKDTDKLELLSKLNEQQDKVIDVNDRITRDHQFNINKLVDDHNKMLDIASAHDSNITTSMQERNAHDLKSQQLQDPNLSQEDRERLTQEVEGHKKVMDQVELENGKLVSEHSRLEQSNKSLYETIKQERSQGIRGTQEKLNPQGFSNEAYLAQLRQVYDENYEEPAPPPPTENKPDSNEQISGKIKQDFNGVAYADTRQGNFETTPSSNILSRPTGINETPAEKEKRFIDANKFANLVSTGILYKNRHDIKPVLSIDTDLLNKMEGIANKDIDALAIQAKRILDPDYTYGSYPMSEQEIGNIPVRLDFEFRGTKYYTYLHDFDTMKELAEHYNDKQKILARADKEGNIIHSELTLNVEGQEPVTYSTKNDDEIYHSYQLMMTRAKAFVLANQGKTITTEFINVDQGSFDKGTPITASEAISSFLDEKKEVTGNLQKDIFEPFISTIDANEKIYNPHSKRKETLVTNEKQIKGKPVIVTSSSHGENIPIFLNERKVDGELAKVLYDALLQELENRGNQSFKYKGFDNISPFNVIKLFLNTENKAGLYRPEVKGKYEKEIKLNGKTLTADYLKNKEAEVKAFLQSLYTKTDQDFLNKDFVKQFSLNKGNSVTINGRNYSEKPYTSQHETEYFRFLKEEKILMTDIPTLVPRQVNVRWGDLSIGERTKEQVKQEPTQEQRQAFFNSGTQEVNLADDFPEPEFDIDSKIDAEDIITGDDLFNDEDFTLYSPTAKIETVDQKVFDKQVEWFRYVLPQIPLSLSQEVIKISGNRDALGAFVTSLGFMRDFNSQYGVYLTNLQESGKPGVTYHEAIHPLFQLLLTRQEQSKILEQLKKEIPNVTKEMMENKKVDSEEKYYEEVLAEKFRVWKNNKLMEAPSSFLEKFFEKIKMLINTLLGRRDVINKLFRDLDSGRFKTRVPITNRISKFYKDYYSIDSPHMSNYAYEKFLDIFVIKLLSEDSVKFNEYPNIKLNTTEENLNKILKDLVNSTNSLKDKQGNPVKVLRGSDAHKNFLAIKELIASNLEKFQQDINTKLDKKYGFKESEDEQDDKTKGIESKSGGTYDVKTSSQAHLARLIVATTLVSNEFADPSLGIPQVADFHSMYNMVLRKLANMPQPKLQKGDKNQVRNIDRYVKILEDAFITHNKPELKTLADKLVKYNVPETSNIVASFYTAVTNDRANIRAGLISSQAGKFYYKDQSSEIASKYEGLLSEWNSNMQVGALIKNGTLSIELLDGEIDKLKELNKKEDLAGIIKVFNAIGINVTQRGLIRTVAITDKKLSTLVSNFTNQYLNEVVRVAKKGKDGLYDFGIQDNIVRAFTLGEADFREDIKDSTYRAAEGALGYLYENPSDEVIKLDRIYTNTQTYKGKVSSTDADFVNRQRVAFHSSSRLIDQINDTLNPELNVEARPRITIAQYSTITRENTGDLGDKAGKIPEEDMLTVILNSALKHYKQGDPIFRLRSKADKSQSDKFLVGYRPIGYDKEEYVRLGGLNKGVFSKKTIDYFMSQIENELLRANYEVSLNSKTVIENFHTQGKAFMLNFFPELNYITNERGEIIDSLDYYLRTPVKNEEERIAKEAKWKELLLKVNKAEVERIEASYEDPIAYNELKKEAFKVLKSITNLKNFSKGDVTKDVKEYKPLRDYIVSRLKNILKNEIQNFRDAGLLKGEKLVGLDKEAWEKWKQQPMYQNRETAEVHKAEDAIANVVINEIIVGIEQHHVFDSDPAYSKSYVDMSKREGAYSSAGLSPMLMKGISNYTKVAHISTPKKVSDYYKTHNEDGSETPFFKIAKEIYGEAFDKIKNTYKTSLKKKEYINSKIKDITDAYVNIDSTDAQGFITIGRHKELMSMFGKINSSPETNAMYDRMEKGIPTEKDLDFFLQPLKLVLVSYNYDDEGRGYIIYHKYSAAVLYPALVKGTEMNNLYSRMLDKEVGEVVFDSGVKIGATNVTDITKGNYQLNPIEIANADYKLQVDLPTKGNHQELLGSQVKKNILSHLDLNKTYGEKLGSQVLDEIVKSIDQLSVRGIENIKSKIYTDEKIDPKKFMDYVKDLLLDREVSPNVVDLIENAVTVDVAPHKSTITANSILSNHNKAAVKIKMPGLAAIQISSYGMKAIGKLSDINANSDIIRLQKDLNPTYIDESGKFVLGSVFLPNYIKEYIDKVKKPEDNINDPEVLKQYLSEGVLGLIGYRIPNQGPSSIDINQVAGFLPKHMGDSIYVYSEITTKVGSDFDVDKMYVVLPNLEVRDGKVQRVPFLREGEDLYNRWLNEKYIDEFKETNKELSRIFTKGLDIEDQLSLEAFLEGVMLNEAFDNNTVGIKLSELFNANPFSTELKEELEKLKDDRDSLLKQKKDKLNQLKEQEKDNFDRLNIYQKNTKKANQNLILENYELLMKDKEMWISSIYPLDAAAKLLKETILNRENFKYPGGVEFYSPSNQLMLKKNNINAKAGVGYAANANSDFKISKLAGVTYHIGDLTIDYNTEYLRDGSSMHDILSAFLTAYVDATKDPFIIQGNFNEYTFGTAMQLFKMGWDVDTVVKFIGNPLLKKLYKIYNSRNSRFTKTMDKEFYMDKEVAFNKLVGGEGLESLYSSFKVDSYKQLAKAVEKFTKADQEFSDLEKVSFLRLFDELRQLSEDIDLKQILASKFDTTGAGKSFAELTAKEQKIREVLGLYNNRDGDRLYSDFIKAVEEGVSNDELDEELNKNTRIKNFHKKFIGTELGVYFRNSVLEAKRIYGNQSIRFSPEMQRTIINIGSRIVDGKGRYRDFVTNEEVAQDIEDAVYGLLMSAIPEFRATNKEIGELFLGPNSLAQRFHKLTQIEIKDGGLKGSALSQVLIPIIHEDPKKPQFIKADNYKVKQPDLLNRISEEWYKLAPDIKDDLVKYSYLSSGFSFYKDSFFDQIPAQWFKDNNIEEKIADIHKSLGTLLADQGHVLDQVMRNNGRNDSLVRNVYDGFKGVSKKNRGEYVIHRDYDGGNDQMWKLTDFNDGDGTYIYTPVKTLGYNFHGKVYRYDIFGSQITKPVTKLVTRPEYNEVDNFQENLDNLPSMEDYYKNELNKELYKEYKSYPNTNLSEEEFATLSQEEKDEILECLKGLK